MISRQQYRKLMQSYQETDNVSQSAVKAGVDRKTARDYIRSGQPPGEDRVERHWRTREDPFAEVWPEVESWLQNSPSLQATRVFEELRRRYPERFEEGQLRSLQRRLQRWRVDHDLSATPKAYCEQVHEPGRLLQLDWFHPRDFEVSIKAERDKHLICHVTLPDSNWEWAIVCQSESFASLKKALQAALWELGGAPAICQVDNSSTARHPLQRGRRQRVFHDRFLGLLSHYGMQGQTINVGAAHENGDVESAHQHLRRYLRDRLQLRGRADFVSIQQYESFVQEQLRHRNGARQKRRTQEREALSALPPSRLPEYEEVPCRANQYGLVRLGKGSYSIPAHYRGQALRARLFEGEIELWYEHRGIARFEQSIHTSGAGVDWPHLMEDLCRKPGAFARYRYRAFFYPHERWRRSCDYLRERYRSRRADSDYLQLLRLTRSFGMERIEALLERLMAENDLSLDRVRRELGEQKQWAQSGSNDTADLQAYDALLSQEVRHG